MISGTIAAIFVAVGTAPDAVESGVLNAWFLDAYQPAVRRVERVYGHLTMQVSTHRHCGPNQGVVSRARYWSFNGCCRVDTRHEPYLNRDCTLIVTPDVGGIAFSGRPVCQQRTCYAGAVSRQCVVQQVRVVCPLAFAPWYCSQQTVEELFLQENATITRCTVDDDPNLGRVCDISWKYLDRGVFRRGGRFRFAMDRSWVLLSTVLDLDDLHRSVARYTYGDEEIEGVPVVLSGEYSLASASGLELVRVCRRHAFSALDSPPDVFDLSRHRIMAAMSDTVADSGIRWDVVAPGLFGVLAVGMFLRGWRRRSGRDAAHGQEALGIVDQVPDDPTSQQAAVDIAPFDAEQRAGPRTGH